MSGDFLPTKNTFVRQKLILLPIRPAENIDAAASELATREAASAAASDLRAATITKKRLEGKEREQQQKKEKAGKKQKA